MSTTLTPQAVGVAYSRQELFDAFDLVQDKDDWRNPIAGSVAADKFDVVAAAVEFFTATTVRVISRTPSRVVIAADGYRKGPAGDH